MTHPLPGYKGRMLTVDLAIGQGEAWAPPEALYREWIGGSALAARLVWDRLGPGLAEVAPFDPANPLMVMTGPLTDSRLPGLPRFTVSARSPQTNLWAESNCGGYFGAELKFAGYDGLIVTGAAAVPSYLLIANDRVALLPAGDLWGQDAYATNDALAVRHALPLPDGRRRLAQVMTIGPAGENRVRYAALINHKAHLSARTGLGAVLGSKNLKALVVVGSGGPATPADPALLRAVRWRMLDRIKGSMVLGALHEYGTSGALELGMYEGDIPVGNWRESPDWHEAAARPWPTASWRAGTPATPAPSPASGWSKSRPAPTRRPRARGRSPRPWPPSARCWATATSKPWPAPTTSATAWAWTPSPVARPSPSLPSASSRAC
jgi:aldehyde:ferredoxin oxidoreductase